MLFPNNRELQQISINHSSDVDFTDFMKLYKSALRNYFVNDTALASGNIYVLEAFFYSL